jgi:hypothetical protein
MRDPTKEGNMNLLIYDCEIIRAIPDRRGPLISGIEYCEGWNDHAHMGVSVLCAYEWGVGYHVYLEDNFAEFKAKAEATDTISIGFNNRRFDDQLVKHLGIDIPPWQSWDLLREIWISKGLNPDSFNPRTHGGGLDAVAMANGLGGKSGNGALAPVLWQQGKKGAVIDYCLRDVMLTKKCVERAIANQLICPVTGETMRLDLGRLSPLPTP